VCWIWLLVLEKLKINNAKCTLFYFKNRKKPLETFLHVCCVLWFWGSKTCYLTSARLTRYVTEYLAHHYEYSAHHYIVLDVRYVSVLLRFKNVLFEISSTDTSGVFEVNAKFMGVNMDKVELLFQVTEYSAHHYFSAVYISWWCRAFRLMFSC